jgi:hypothetical protein
MVDKGIPSATETERWAHETSQELDGSVDQRKRHKTECCSGRKLLPASEMLLGLRPNFNCGLHGVFSSCLWVVANRLNIVPVWMQDKRPK